MPAALLPDEGLAAVVPWAEAWPRAAEPVPRGEAALPDAVPVVSPAARWCWLLDELRAGCLGVKQGAHWLRDGLRDAHWSDFPDAPAMGARLVWLDSVWPYLVWSHWVWPRLA